MKNFLLIIVSLLSPAFTHAQGAVADLTEAEDLFQRKAYSQVVNFYLDKIERKNANGNIYYKTGICYLNSRSQKTKAADYFEKAIEQSTSFYTHGLAKESDAPMDVFFYLGEAYRWQFKFEEAVQAYEKYVEKLRDSKTENPPLLLEVENRIKASKFDNEIKQMYALPPNFLFTGLIQNPEKPLGECSSELSPDKTNMIYTIKVPVSKLKKSEDERYFDDPISKSSKNDSDSKKTKTKLPKLHQDTIVNITTVGTSVDGQIMITYKDDKGEGNLYVQRLLANEWSHPQKLPKTVNRSGWEPYEFMSADGTILYFVSERAGGYGGKDIYKCKKLPNGEWGKAVNLGPDINSANDEQAPFLHSDGTLFFSSNKLRPTVSYDIYSCTQNPNGWSKPLAVGYPINSSEDNRFYQVASEKKKLLAEKNNTVTGKKEKSKSPPEKSKKDVKKIEDSLIAGNDGLRDHYLVSFESPTKNNMILLRGQVAEKKDKVKSSLSSQVLLINNSTGKILSEIRTNKHGQFSLVIPHEVNCNLTFLNEGYLFSSLNQSISPSKNYFSVQDVVILSPLAEGSSTYLNNVFFEEDNARLQANSVSELERVLELMVKNESMHIKLTNHIYSKEKSHKQLSKDRAEAVKKYLTEKGIDKKRIKCSGERLSRKDFPKNEWSLLNPDKPAQKLELKITALDKKKEN